MKNIKSFKYVNINIFNEFISSYGYTLDDVVGFSAIEKEQYEGNVLKTYAIYFNDNEEEYFKVVVFKNFNEYHQSALGFNGNKLLDWYQDSNVIKYKYNDGYVTVKCRS